MPQSGPFVLAYEVHLPEGVSNVDNPFACYAYVSNTGNEGDDGDNRMNGGYSMASSEDSSYPSVYLYEEESSTYYYSPIDSMRVELSGSTITLSQDPHQELIPSHKLYGSNDGENWVILDEQSSISFSTSETKYFSLRSNPRSYKLKITSEVDLADWQGYSAIYANPWTPINLFYPEST